MGKKRITVNKINEILRLKSLGHNKAETAKLLNLNRETIRKYWEFDLKIEMPESPNWVKEIDWKYIESELGKVSKKILYEEQKESINLPSYQAFCQYIRNNKKAKKVEVTIKIDRTPGASSVVDI